MPRPKTDMSRACRSCGMVTKGAPEYHPYAACLMMRGSRHGGSHVAANLRAVVEYGMRAERAGVTVDVAMADLSKVPPL